MHKYAGVTLDHYDDRGETLKSKFPEAGQLPDAIKLANFKEKTELPNEAFALVAIDGAYVMRKYACHDAGNTATSVIYFMEHSHKLPEDAVKMAAANLMNACVTFGLLPPLELTKQAQGGNADSGHPGKTCNEAHPTLTHGEFEKDAGFSDWFQNESSKNLKKVMKPGMSGKEIVEAYNKKYGKEKKASVVNITGQSPKLKVAASRPTRDEEYAIITQDGKRFYPIDNWNNVKLASDYWREHHRAMDASIRREFATKLAAQADQLGFPLDDQIRTAGSTTWADPEWVRSSVEMRKIACSHRDDAHKANQVLEDLFFTRESYGPEKYAQHLRRFDVELGLTDQWDNGIPDPYASTFGIHKVADVVWEHGADRVTSSELHNLALNHGGGLVNIFSQDLIQSFEKDPVGIFNSLPYPQKRILARLSVDMVSQGGSEGQVPITSGSDPEPKRKHSSLEILTNMSKLARATTLKAIEHNQLGT